VICAVTYAAVFNVTEHRSSSETEWARRPRPYVSRLTSYVALFLACFLIFISARDLLADHYYGSVSRILDDKTTEELDLKPISESTMPDYLDAVRSLNTAAALAPSRPSVLKSLSDLCARLGRWAETMESLSAPLPASAPLKKDAFDNAVIYLKRAISLEPTNPDYHLALGQLYETAYKDGVRADAEFVKALDAYPRNAPTRYAVAMQYLHAGEKDKALEQARLLARLDDSYILDDDRTGRKAFMRERRPPEYVTKLWGSYLFGALEITWRVSEDPATVKGIAPDTQEARDVVQAFMEWKGIE
jgi:tetratricopeptide (TPR) repeat protein